MYSCGKNNFGQLGIQHNNSCLKKVHAIQLNKNFVFFCSGKEHSLFLDEFGCVYSVGSNVNGQLGTGSMIPQYNTLQKIANIPKIKLISCGYKHSLLVDYDNHLWCFGNNSFGQLGTGDTINQKIPVEIKNLSVKQIPGGGIGGLHTFIKDIHGKIYTMGHNKHGQLGIDTSSQNILTPSKIIEKYNPIWGNNETSTTNNNSPVISPLNIYPSILHEDNDQVISTLHDNNTQSTLQTNNNQSNDDSMILGDFLPKSSTDNLPDNDNVDENWKEFSNIMEWDDIDCVTIEKIKSKFFSFSNMNQEKYKQSLPPSSFECWSDVKKYLAQRLLKINEIYEEKQDQQIRVHENIAKIENEITNVDEQIKILQDKKTNLQDTLDKNKNSQQTSQNQLQIIEKYYEPMSTITNTIEIFCVHENEINNEIKTLFNNKSFDKFDCEDISKLLLWKMDLVKYHDIFEKNNITGEIILLILNDKDSWSKLNIHDYDIFLFQFHFNMMKCNGYKNTLESDYSHDCPVCSHKTPKETLFLIQEYDIPIDKDFILSNNITTPMLIYGKASFIDNIFSPEGRKIATELDQLRKLHEQHLDTLNEDQTKLIDN